MAEIRNFAENIGAERLIAICPYHQYFDCLAYTDNVIFCHEKDQSHLMQWLEHTKEGLIDIDFQDLEIGFNSQKISYFSYLETTKQTLANQLAEHIQTLKKTNLPKIQMRFLACAIHCSESFEFNDYDNITKTIQTLVDIDIADILYGINFNMLDGSYTLHLLMA